MRDGYKKLDRSKLKSRKHTTLSMKEAISQISPMQWNEEVYNGTKKVLIDKQGIHYVPSR